MCILLLGYGSNVILIKVFFFHRSLSLSLSLSVCVCVISSRFTKMDFSSFLSKTVHKIRAPNRHKQGSKTSALTQTSETANRIFPRLACVGGIADPLSEDENKDGEPVRPWTNWNLKPIFRGPIVPPWHPASPDRPPRAFTDGEIPNPKRMTSIVTQFRVMTPRGGHPSVCARRAHTYT